MSHLLCSEAERSRLHERRGFVVGFRFIEHGVCNHSETDVDKSARQTLDTSERADLWPVENGDPHMTL
ncbi:hypothetical protein DPMN_125206 [Dreissena polymorpha]|uniref:Uncharacterized protein n=1 Tax=Dreissena polymorpha TaxID=45954 RepID=A0A9D4GUZ4_DREPO|nr:hypothetical protein DPMN_125206 [Dreissena polymorpha]